MAIQFNFSLSDFKTAASIIYQHLNPTPQISWPLLNGRCGCETWVKHENHLPTGAFKVRGGLWYMENLVKSGADIAGVICATRGNHGQSVAFAARKHGLKAYIIIPHGNNPEKNRAMQGYGAELIEYGEDFNEALDHAQILAKQRGLHLFPSCHPHLIQGVGTYAIELINAVADLHTVYVPIGMGSGICGTITARNALNLKTKIVGVVAENAPAYANSFASGKFQTSETANTLADGLAVRVPDEYALECILHGAERVVMVSEEEILQAMQYYFIDTHNIAEGAGAAPLAALLKERDNLQGKKVGLILSGGNVDRSLYEQVLRD